MAVVAQIDQGDVRQRPFQHPPRQRQQRVLAALGVVPAFQRRRGRAEDDRHAFHAGPHDGHVAGMVARRQFLLEGGFMFLIDDDQAQLARRREHGTAGPDDDLNLPRRDLPPVAAALGRLQMAVQHGHLSPAAAEGAGSSAASG